MSNFIVFTYQFSPVVDEMQSLFMSEIDPTESMERKNEIFDNILNDERVVITYRNSMFRRRTILSRDGLIVFKLANKRYIRIEEDFHSNTIENYPSILVIVDNRKDKQRILIEQKTGAFYDVEYVARILQNSLRQYLKRYQLSLAISREYISSEFWDVIKGFDKGVEKIRFSFPYPNLSRIRDTMKSLISDINAATNSKDTRVELNAAPGESLFVNEDNETISDLVEASAGTGQGIVIKAKGIKRQQVVGETMKIISIDDFEGVFPEMLVEKLLDKLDGIN